MDVIEFDRVMIATPDLESTIDNLESKLDVSFSRKNTEIDDSNVQLGYSFPGIELLSPGDPDDAVASFLDDQGPGVYGIVLRVSDLEAAKEELAEQGVDPIMEAGAEDAPEAFYHPKEFDGVFTILTEYTHPGFKD